METKKCTGCKKLKSKEDFSKRSDRKIGVQAKCKECQGKDAKKRRKKMPEVFKNYDRKTHLKRHYNLSLDEYNLIYEKQLGKCACCGKHQHELKRALDVDHDHTTGEIRGLLCSRCNTAIGYVEEKKEILEEIILYLKKH
jgi:hypothetical protein